MFQFLDSTCFAAQLEYSSHVARAVLHSEAGLGARAFLNAMPSGRTRMEPATFIAELRIRLGVPEATDDCWCPRLILCVPGLSGLAFGRRRSARTFCCSLALKTRKQADVALPMSFCLPLLGFPLRLTSLLQRLRGRRP
ncbi:ANK1 [Symbiodinium natans]|uniref:ANK1 protein n=1 Tax=Symbiodinium natans TaxID=878477 RepID=A0A812MSN1_9DINO|nr:ANK1 [Symbiodinium natans]